MLRSLPRSIDTLLPIIQQHILPGTTIYSDGWSAYNCLSEHGFIHGEVLHNQEFLNAEDPTLHTQTLERMWRDLKEWTKFPGMLMKHLRQYVSRWYFLRDRPTSEALHDYLIQVGHTYPHRVI